MIRTRPDGKHPTVGALCKHGRVQVSRQGSLGQSQVLHLCRNLRITFLDDRLHHQSGTLHNCHRRMLITPTVHKQLLQPSLCLSQLCSKRSLSLSLCFNGNFSRRTCICQYHNVSNLDLLETSIMEVTVTTEAVSRAKLQSNRHQQRTNIQLLSTGRKPFPSPKQQRQSTAVTGLLFQYRRRPSGRVQHMSV